KISRDLKEAALRLWDLGWEEAEIMQGLVISRSSLYRWKKLFEEFGSQVCPQSPLRGHPRVITQAVLTAIYDIYQKNSTIYLDKLRWWLAIHHNIVISVSALQRNLEQVGLAHKLLHIIARERTKQQHDDYHDAINSDLGGDSDVLIFTDETSKNDRANTRRYGRSFAAAMSKDEYLAIKVLPGSFDSFDFFDYVAEQVV
ncbi:hypothetical protein B0H15DRAFT_738610, partial [Mycena belliarum]